MIKYNNQSQFKKSSILFKKKSQNPNPKTFKRQARRAYRTSRPRLRGVQDPLRPLYTFLTPGGGIRRSPLGWGPHRAPVRQAGPGQSRAGRRTRTTGPRRLRPRAMHWRTAVLLPANSRSSSGRIARIPANPGEAVSSAEPPFPAPVVLRLRCGCLGVSAAGLRVDGRGLLTFRSGLGRKAKVGVWRRRLFECFLRCLSGMCVAEVVCCFRFAWRGLVICLSR